MSETKSATLPPHPKGLWVLFVTEMWERFSYYGMRALLVLYLISKVDGSNPGLGWSEESAGKLYGSYTACVYLTPVVDGWLADKFLGTHRSMMTGGWIIAAGHFTLALTELFGHGTLAVVNAISAHAKNVSIRAVSTVCPRRASHSATAPAPRHPTSVAPNQTALK